MINIALQGSILVQGTIGKGKTTLLRSMIREGLDGEVSVISSRGGLREFGREVDADLVHRVTPSGEARKEIQRVYDVLCARKDRRLDDGEKTTENAIFLFIDEATGVLFPIDPRDNMPEDAMKHLEELITLGHTVNIHMVVAGHEFDKAFASRFGVTVDVNRHVIQYRTIAAIA